MKEFIKINSKDNVVIVLRNYKKDEVIKIDEKEIKILQETMKGHKIALENISKGENILKYGMPIGYALEDIKVGEWVHTHNIRTNLKDLSTYEYTPEFEKELSSSNKRKVKVYRRKNGDVGIRNELWIVPTVGCVNGIANLIKEAFLKEIGDLKVDGINVLTHNYGCSQLGEDHINTRTILQNTVKHPNAGGVLVLGLGCENNQVSEFIKTLGEYDEERVKFLISQEVEDEIESGKEILKSLYKKMLEDKREEGELGEINFGLECGGSDGLSGITANPMLGHFSDYVISQGGTSVLTEVPEMFGAETLLMTTGSKNIPEYVYITDYKERVYLRLLPNPEMLQSAIEAGIMPSHLIGMQGPFSQELNEAVIRQFNIGVLVTKESGSNGGYEEKVSATENTGIDCIVIKRPVEENGVSLPELIKYLKTKGL